MGQEDRQRGQAQWLGAIGKTDNNGVVSVSSLWAKEGVYYPLDVEPYTPAHHFEKGKADPRFRTRLKIAQELVQRSVAEGVPFRGRWWPTRSTAKTRILGGL